MRVFVRILFSAVIAALSYSAVAVQTETEPDRYCNEGLGVCTKYTRCSNATVFNDGSGHINVRFYTELETEACHYLEICCNPEDVIKEQDAYPFERVTSDNVDRPWQELKVTSEKPTTTLRPPIPIIEVPEPSKPCEDSCTETIEIVPTTTPFDESFSQTKNNTCDNEFNECIPFFLCDEPATTDGSDLLTSRFSGDSESSSNQCPLESQVCCSRAKNLARMKPTKCGLRNRDGLCYIASNDHEEANYAEFPWMAALMTETSPNCHEYFCGGSLIHPQVILTSAHCIHDKKVRDLKVRLGEWDPQTNNEIFPHIDVDVSEIVVSPGFILSNLHNDIGLLKLRNPVAISMFVNTVCLPPQNFKPDQSKCVASGWGTEKFGQAGIYRANMKKKDLPLVPLRMCQDCLRKTRLGPRFKIDQSFMCAGGEENVDTCTGDGGSPLVCQVTNQPDQFYQHGIVAWGIECGQPGVPGVYANVAKFREWIDQQMGIWNFGTESYTAEHVNYQKDDDFVPED